jgi:eukaryotic-like serine/threonine-protein kinase
VPELYSTRPGTAESRPFGLERADLLAISTSGDLAVSLNRRFQGAFTFTGVAARVPLAGGAPREILENVQYADWSPDGQSLLIVREIGGRTRLEFPAGRVLYETAGWLSHPRVSPHKDVVAFIDHQVRGDDAGSVSVVTRAGAVKTLSTGWLSAQGLAWSGDEVWFTATATGGARALFAVTLDGALRPVVRVAGGLVIQDVFPDGRVLLTRDSSRIGMAALDSGETRERDLSWLDWSLARALGRDGRTVLFDETGEGGGPHHGVYVRKMDGSPAVRLGDGIAQDLSPDGKWAASFPSGRNEIVLLPTGPGEPKKVPVKNVGLQRVLFFQDGKTLLIAGNEPGHAVRLYAQAIDGGEARPLSPEGITGTSIAIAPDGLHVLAQAADQQYYLFPVGAGEPTVVKGISSDEGIAGWNPSGASLFIFERARVPSTVYEVPLGGGPRRLITRIEAVAASLQIGIQNLRFTPDLKGYVYSYFRTDAELYLVDGLK